MEKQQIKETLNGIITLAQETWPDGLAEQLPAVAAAIQTRNELINDFTTGLVEDPSAGVSTPASL